jgi:transcriptional regulator with XRE-family HTH domain
MDGDELRQRRKALGLSQTELGERIGIRQPTISSWEQGHTSIGNPRMLALALWALEHGVGEEEHGHTENPDGAARRAD